jgi:lysophospholipase L1-like esterase
MIFYSIGGMLTFGVCLLAFVCYLRFSYLLVPIKLVVGYDINLKIQNQEGYYKFQPGEYANVQHRTHFTINEDGFRGSTTKLDLKEGYSVLALGESSTMGIEVPDHRTWPEQLNVLLRQDKIDSRVLNAGIGGINSAQMLRLYNQELHATHPKLIIYYAGRNDHGLGSGVIRYPGPLLWTHGFWGWLKNYVAFKKTELRFYQYKLFGKQYFELLPSVNLWLSAYKNNLTQIIQKAKAQNTCFVIVQQIMPFDPVAVNYLRKNEFDKARASISTEQPLWPELFRQIDLYEAQQELALTHHLPFVNLLAQNNFDNKKLFIDSVHLTEQGNEYVANHLAANIPSLCLKAKD